MRIGNVIASRRRKFAALLVLALVTLAIQMFDTQPGASRLLSDVFRTMLSVAILVVVFERRRERTAMAVVLVVTIVIGWVRYFSNASLEHALSLATCALMALYLSVAVGVILRDLFCTPAVGAENVLGAICGYLIAGGAWAAVNALTFLLLPETYSISPDVEALLTDWQGRLALFSYYSFAQMLTLGYSDVTPVRAPATTLSLLGALFGLFYTAIVVSQFVGMADSGKRETP